MGSNKKYGSVKINTDGAIRDLTDYHNGPGAVAPQLFDDMGIIVAQNVTIRSTIVPYNVRFKMPRKYFNMGSTDHDLWGPWIEQTENIFIQDGLGIVDIEFSGITGNDVYIDIEG